MFKLIIMALNFNIVEFECDSIDEANTIKRFVLDNGIAGESTIGATYYLPPSRIKNTNIIAL